MAKQDRGVQWVDLPLNLDWELVDPADTASTICSYRSSTIATANALVLQTQTIAQRLYNWLPYKKGDGSIGLRARDGLVPRVGFAKGASVTNPRGIFFSPNLKIAVEFWNTIVYTQTADDTYTSTGLMGAATEGPGGVCEGVDTSGNTYLFCSTPTRSVSVSSTGVHTVISDADFPTTTTGTPAYMDGYVFIPQSETRRIYNSAVGDQTTWTATGYIEVEEASGDVMEIAIHHKHVVAFCRDRIEFFINAAIPAPNSPLQRVAEKKLLVGCPNRATIAQDGDVIYFLGISSQGGSVGIYKLEDFRIEKVSNDSIDSLLRLYGAPNRNWGKSQSFASTANDGVTHTTAYMIQFGQKMYYCLCTNAGIPVNAGTDTTPTLIYDPELKIWVEIGNAIFTSPSTYAVGGWGFPYGCVYLNSLTGLTGFSYVLQAYNGGANDVGVYGLSAASYTAELLAASGGSTSADEDMLLLIDFPVLDFGTIDRKVISGVALDFSFPRVSNTTLPYGTHSGFGSGFDAHVSEFRVTTKAVSAGNAATVADTFTRLNLTTLGVVPASTDQYQQFIRMFGMHRQAAATLSISPTSTTGSALLNKAALRISVHPE